MICIKFTDELTIRDIHLSNVCVPYGKTLQDIMLDILNIEYPELRFYTIMDVFKYEIRYRIIKADTQETLKDFKFDYWEYDFKHDPDKIFKEIVDWCEDYYHPKPKPVVEKVEVIIQPHHCKCCGAPIPKGVHECEYCGIEYY